MLICKTCGETFDEPRTMFDNGYRDVCPTCWDTEISDAERCRFCDEWTAEDDLDEGACPECKKSLNTKLLTLIRENFTADEIDWLEWTGFAEGERL